MIRKRLRKIIRHLPLIFCIPKKNKYVQVIAQKVIGIVKKKKILLMIPNEEKAGWHYLAEKKLSISLRGIT